MYKDKKNIGNKINFTLIPELGQFQVNHEIDEHILQCMDLYSRTMIRLSLSVDKISKEAIHLPLSKVWLIEY